MIYQALFKLVLQWLPPSLTHSLGTSSLRVITRPPAVRGLLRAWAYPRGDRIQIAALGRTFPSPLGAAAGLDKNADWFEALGAIGFGFVEIGTVTPHPQEANPGRTIVRLRADRGLLNRMGFPNHGARAAAAHLAARSDEILLGANIGKQRTTPLGYAADDYCEVARLLGPYADYVVVNVSSPNTPGLRDLQATEQLEPLIEKVKLELTAAAPGRPLLVKISPDLSDEDVDAVADMALRLGLDGIVATNTTIDRGTLVKTPASTLRWFEGGGVSGPPLKARSLEVLRRLYERTDGRLTLISVGGVESVDDVWERIAHGATLVQAYTGFIYGGPAFAGQINRRLNRRVRQAGLRSIQDLIGAVVRERVGE